MREGMSDIGKNCLRQKELAAQPQMTTKDERTRTVVIKREPDGC